MNEMWSLWVLLGVRLTEEAHAKTDYREEGRNDAIAGSKRWTKFHEVHP